MKQLKNSDKPIDFKSADYLGNEVILSNYIGKKILLSFFRGTVCPFCIARIKELIKKHSEIAAEGIQLVVVVSTNREDILKTAGKNKTPFPIIPDPDQKIFKQYGLSKSKYSLFKTIVNPLNMLKVMLTNPMKSSVFKEESFLPGEFLINEDFRIRLAYYGKYLCDNLPLDEVIKEWRNDT